MAMECGQIYRPLTGEAGADEPVVAAGEEDVGARAEVGDVAAVGAGDHGWERWVFEGVRHRMVSTGREASRLAYAMWPKNMPVSTRRRTSALRASAASRLTTPSSARRSAPKSTMVGV